MRVVQGLSEFESQVKNQPVHVYSDNKGAEAAVAKGGARCFDHTCVVHSIWFRALLLGMHMVVDRVPSKVNLADDPSRERYGLLQQYPNCVRVRPWLHPMFTRPRAWESLATVECKLLRRASAREV